MRTKSKTTMRLGQDLETFESLSVETQDLAALQDLASKTTGTENADINEQIQEASASKTIRRRKRPTRP